MAAINDLIDRISDPELRRRIGDEVARMQQQKKFGLVFEEHLPEATPLYDVPIKRKSLVAEKDGFFKVFYRVKRIEGEKLICETQDDKHEEVCFEKEKMVAVAMFGDPIYPYLKPIDEVQNAPDDKLWHTLIEAENYHALQLLIYLYGGKVDCIYIDPPYNTGAKDWKYNNDYVEETDSYRHSKWLNMIKRRLELAKRLLNPDNSTLIVTIDEKEYDRLGCLLEEVFPEAEIQMISSVIMPSGSSRTGRFGRADEYIYFCFFGKSVVHPGNTDMLRDAPEKTIPVRWNGLIRNGEGSRRSRIPSLFYPILFDKSDGHLISVEEPIPADMSVDDYQVPEGMVAMWPIDKSGKEQMWRLYPPTLREYLKEGYAKLGKRDKETGIRPISYLQKGMINKINSGKIIIVGRNSDGALELEYADNGKTYAPLTVWNRVLHSAAEHGSGVLKKILLDRHFPFPKSVYAIQDALRFVTANKKNALIVDFFAGSGTTLHAVNLLNAEDDGHRRCIMITNNEISADEEMRLKREGYKPCDDVWEQLGISRYINWPRTKCSILGIDVMGNKLVDDYPTHLKTEKERPRNIKKVSFIDNPHLLTTSQKKELVALCFKGQLPQSLVKADSKFIVSEGHTGSILFDINYAEEWLEALDGQDQVTDIYIVTQNNKEFKRIKEEIQETLGNIIEEVPVMRPMSEGFAANAKYFKLGFLDKDSVELQRQFRELLPLLWMKAGAIGRCPELEGGDIPEILLLEDNSMAILTDEEVYVDFRKLMARREDIKSIFIVTNSEDAFMSMAKPFSWAQCYQLYKDYLENFSINYERR